MATDMNIHDGLAHSEDPLTVAAHDRGEYLMFTMQKGTDLFRFMLHTRDVEQLSAEYVEELASGFLKFSILLGLVHTDEEE